MIPFPFVVRVVGVSWCQETIVRVAVGDAVDVRHDKDNERDSNAMEVTVRGEKIGFLPKSLAARLVREKIGHLYGVVTEISGHDVLGVSISLSGAVSAKAAAKKGGRVLVSPVVGDTSRPVRVRASGRVVGYLLNYDKERGVVRVEGSKGPVEYADDLVVIDEKVSA